jgi:hypothetical protein
MIERWRKLSAKERFKAQIVMAFMIIGVYGLILYPISHRKLQESERMIHRRKDRIEKRANIKDVGGNNLSPKVLAVKIEDVEKRIEEVSTSFGGGDLDSGFAPVESDEARQELLVEISTLAERTGVDLLSISRKGVPVRNEKAAAPAPSDLGRPMLEIKAAASFKRLLDFLHGLKDLSFYVSVTNLKLYATPPGGGREAAAPAGALYVSLEMSI